MRALQNLLLIAALITSFMVVPPNQKTMNTQHKEKFYIVGIATRTINENGQSGHDIENLWKRFWDEEIQKQIPNTTSEDIYAVYTDYESDFNGAYTTIIGLPVSFLEDIPEGFVGITIDGAEYQKFVSRGKMPEAVFNTWLEIWNDTGLDRAYIADFTVHGKKYYDGDNAEVETYISINK